MPFNSMAVRCVLALLVLTALLVELAAASSYFTQVPTTGNRWAPRAGSFNFEFAGALWVLGGYNTQYNSGISYYYTTATTTNDV